MHTALTIAGSDCSGGAGIQADIKTMQANKVYTMSVITALTAQNTLGVQGILPVSESFIELQLDSIFQDIFPDAVKIGMLNNKETILSLAKKLKQYKAKNIVLDPVMISSSGTTLMKEDAIETLIKELFPLADLITPNIPEAEYLTKVKIKNLKDMETAAFELCKIINSNKTAILIKGGHSIGDPCDLLIKEGKITFFNGKRIENPNNHGTGCTLSSAIASGLAKNLDLETSIKNAKEYLNCLLKDNLNLGKGNGPLNHIANNS